MAGDLQEDLLNREEIQEVQKALEELLGEDSFSFFDMLLDLMNGETGQLKEEFSDLIREVFLRQLIQEKALFVEILLLVLAAALFDEFYAPLFRGPDRGSEFLCYLPAASDYAGQGLRGDESGASGTS